MKYIGAFIISLFTFAMQAQNNITIALVQAGFVWGNAEANIDAFEKRLKNIESCDLIVLPELFISGCQMLKKDQTTAFNQKKQIASYYNKAIERMKKWAFRTNALVIGSTIYMEEDKFYNRLLAVYPDGHFKYYDKHNCFKKGGFTSGNDHLIIHWKGIRIATYICYDLRFAEWSANNGQYDMAIYIANWPESKKDDWNTLLRERATSNKATVVGVNCVGTDLAGKNYQGNSCILSPDGKLVGKCAENKDEILILNVPRN